MYSGLTIIMEGKVMTIKDRDFGEINRVIFVEGYSKSKFFLPVFVPRTFDIELRENDIVKVVGQFWNVGSWGMVLANRIERMKVLSKKTVLGEPFVFGTGKIFKIIQTPKANRLKTLLLSFGNLDNGSLMLLANLNKYASKTHIYAKSCADISGKLVKTNVLNISVTSLLFRSCSVVTQSTVPIFDKEEMAKIYVAIKGIVRSEGFDDTLMRINTWNSQKELYMQAREELKEITEEAEDAEEIAEPEVIDDDDEDIILRF